MKISPHFVLVAVAMPLAAQVRPLPRPLEAERWERTLQPPAGGARIPQCAVLDAAVFAAAAPGLTDLRLVQGRHELPYAMDESHDDGASTSDRSLYDAVGLADFHADRAAPEGFVHPGAPGSRVAWFTLPAHVPVERITLLGDVDQSTPVQVIAHALNPEQAGSASEPEIVQLGTRDGQLALPVTLGANLQHTAAVSVVIGHAPRLTGVRFEMRRREVCFRPRTDEPVRMVFGDPDALPIRYDFARHYQPTATPLLATMGPLTANPDYAAVAPQPLLTLRQKLVAAIGLCMAMLATTIGAMFALTRKK